YGRSHTNFVVAPPSSGPVFKVVDRFCPRSFAPGAESTVTLGTFRGQLTAMLSSLDAASRALAANDPAAGRVQYGQFASTYGGVSKELAELYPVRCSRLLADRLEGDAAILATPSVKMSEAVASISA